MAHALLWKMKFEGVYGSKMAFAFNTFISKMVTKERGIHHTYKISSRVYETFRKQYATMMSETQRGADNHFYGRKHSEETRRIIGEKSKLKEFKKGPDNPNWGKKLNISPEERLKRSALGKQRWADPVYKEKMLVKRKAYLSSPAGIKQVKETAEKKRGIKKSPEAIEKTAAAKRGKTWEELYTPEQIQRMREAAKNKVYTPEGKQRQIEATRKLGKRPKSEDWKRKMSERMTGIVRDTKTCQHCGKVTVLSNHNRWHGDNCKTLRLSKICTLNV
jgi:ribosomal protein S27AE